MSSIFLCCACKNARMETIESDAGTYLLGKCGNCSREVRFIPRIIRPVHHGAEHDLSLQFEPLECPACNLGTVANPAPADDVIGRTVQGSGRLSKDYVLSPGPLPAARVAGLPEDIEQSWDEVLRCGQSSAWTASELMCRKILMHVAVDQFNAAEGRAFTEYVKALDEARFFPAPLTKVIDGIRERGNRATHDLAKTTEVQARKTIEITHHVLRTIYELPS